MPLVLCGCADFKGMPSLGISLPDLFQQKPMVDTLAKLQKDWWKSTNDETLKSIILQLETENLSLAQARFRLLAARAESPQSDYLPSLTASTNAQYNRLIKGETAIQNLGIAQAGGKKTTGFYDAKIDASWEVPLFGQYNDAGDIRNANIAYAEADVDAVRASVISEAVRLYAEMRARQLEIVQSEAIFNATGKIVEYQTIKHRAGLITDTELGDSRKIMLSAQIDKEAVKSELVARQQQLARLLGKVKPGESWDAPANLPTFDLPAFADTPIDVLRNRPDIRKAEASVLAAAGDFELAKSEMYPKLTLAGSLSQLDNLTGKPLMGKTVQLGGIPTLSLPLFDWGKRLANAKIKDEKLSETASAYRESVIAAMNEVEEFWSSYRAAQASEAITQENSVITQKAVEHTQLLFKQGIKDGIEVENAGLEAARSAITHIKAQADTITKLAALTKALGGVNEPNIEKFHD
jgi:NodT family efflux transporter outer membrane factor (OMF) lipoprotein